jgi:hypothetical protein
MTLELTQIIEIKSMGLRLDGKSTQKELASALKHRPELKEQGIIIEVKGNSNGKAEKKA